VAVALSVTKASLHYHFPSNTPKDAARVITSALEGAMLLARPYGEGARFTVAAGRVLRGFIPAPVKRRRRPRRTPEPEL